MKIIFLDVDGVLITADSCHKGFGIVEPRCVDALNNLVSNTGAAIVVSSCWRVGRTRIELCDLLQKWGVKGVVLDKTPHSSFSAKRGNEIQEWLDERRENRDDVEQFVILDDDADMEHLMPFLVQTNFTDGLTEDLADRAGEILLAGRAPLSDGSAEQSVKEKF